MPPTLTWRCKEEDTIMWEAAKGPITYTFLVVMFADLILLGFALLAYIESTDKGRKDHDGKR